MSSGSTGFSIPFKKTEKDSFVNSCFTTARTALCTILLFWFCKYMSSDKNCGDDVRGLITSMMWIKGLAVFPLYSLVGALTSADVIDHGCANSIVSIFWLYMMTWYSQIIQIFFAGSNNCWSTAGWLWFAGFLLVIEAIINVLLAVCAIAAIIVLICACISEMRGKSSAREFNPHIFNKELPSMGSRGESMA
ncbi:unnamed protein product [Moneuplotes crassus]|uniref:Transmembrane protein n=2 Tax=Euplotes crassus TaxID=5936 RepID=A0AAD1XPT7_EUPCR|nr:unnamed protein product [Moneuplotes crassus]